MDFSFRFSANASGNSSVETAGSLANAGGDTVETAGSLACLFNGGGMDSFGSKDMFGSPDVSNMDSSFFASAPQVETAGSLACANFGASAGFDFANVSVSSFGSDMGGGGDFGGACASVGGDAGGSCGGGGSFSSVC